MDSKSMKEIEVYTDSEMVVLRQPNEAVDGGCEMIWLSPDQVPVVIEWLREAAGLPTGTGGRKPEEVRSQAHMFRRLEPAAAGGPQDRGSSIEGIRVALEWAAGESDLAPDVWLYDE